MRKEAVERLVWAMAVAADMAQVNKRKLIKALGPEALDRLDAITSYVEEGQGKASRWFEGLEEEGQAGALLLGLAGWLHAALGEPATGQLLSMAVLPLLRLGHLEAVDRALGWILQIKEERLN